MDYYTLSRRQLQSLCKKHAISANGTNTEMAEALSTLLKNLQPLDKKASMSEKRVTRGSENFSSFTADDQTDNGDSETRKNGRKKSERPNVKSQVEEKATAKARGGGILLRRGKVKVRSPKSTSQSPISKEKAEKTGGGEERSRKASEVDMEQPSLPGTKKTQSRRKKGTVTFSNTVEVKSIEVDSQPEDKPYDAQFTPSQSKRERRTRSSTKESGDEDTLEIQDLGRSVRSLRRQSLAPTTLETSIKLDSQPEEKTYDAQFTPFNSRRTRKARNCTTETVHEDTVETRELGSSSRSLRRKSLAATTDGAKKILATEETEASIGQLKIGNPPPEADKGEELLTDNPCKKLRSRSRSGLETHCNQNGAQEINQENFRNFSRRRIKKGDAEGVENDKKQILTGKSIVTSTSGKEKSMKLLRSTRAGVKIYTDSETEPEQQVAENDQEVEAEIAVVFMSEASRRSRRLTIAAAGTGKPFNQTNLETTEFNQADEQTAASKRHRNARRTGKNVTSNVQSDDVRDSVPGDDNASSCVEPSEAENVPTSPRNRRSKLAADEKILQSRTIASAEVPEGQQQRRRVTAKYVPRYTGANVAEIERKSKRTSAAAGKLCMKSNVINNGHVDDGGSEMSEFERVAAPQEYHNPRRTGKTIGSNTKQDAEVTGSTASHETNEARNAPLQENLLRRRRPATAAEIAFVQGGPGEMETHDISGTKLQSTRNIRSNSTTSRHNARGGSLQTNAETQTTGEKTLKSRQTALDETYRSYRKRGVRNTCFSKPSKITGVKGVKQTEEDEVLKLSCNEGDHRNPTCRTEDHCKGEMKTLSEVDTPTQERDGWVESVVCSTKSEVNEDVEVLEVREPEVTEANKSQKILPRSQIHLLSEEDEGAEVVGKDLEANDLMDDLSFTERDAKEHHEVPTVPSQAYSLAESQSHKCAIENLVESSIYKGNGCIDAGICSKEPEKHSVLEVCEPEATTAVKMEEKLPLWEEKDGSVAGQHEESNLLDEFSDENEQDLVDKLVHHIEGYEGEGCINPANCEGQPAVHDALQMRHICESEAGSDLQRLLSNTQMPVWEEKEGAAKGLQMRSVENDAEKLVGSLSQESQEIETTKNEELVVNFEKFTPAESIGGVQQEALDVHDDTDDHDSVAAVFDMYSKEDLTDQGLSEDMQNHVGSLAHDEGYGCIDAAICTRQPEAISCMDISNESEFQATEAKNNEELLPGNQITPLQENDDLVIYIAQQETQDFLDDTLCLRQNAADDVESLKRPSEVPNEAESLEEGLSVDTENPVGSFTAEDRRCIATEISSRQPEPAADGFVFDIQNEMLSRKSAHLSEEKDIMVDVQQEAKGSGDDLSFDRGDAIDDHTSSSNLSELVLDAEKLVDSLPQEGAKCIDAGVCIVHSKLDGTVHTSEAHQLEAANTFNDTEILFRTQMSPLEEDRLVVGSSWHTSNDLLVASPSGAGVVTSDHGNYEFLSAVQVEAEIEKQRLTEDLKYLGGSLPNNDEEILTQNQMPLAVQKESAVLESGQPKAKDFCVEAVCLDDQETLKDYSEPIGVVEVSDIGEEICDVEQGEVVIISRKHEQEDLLDEIFLKATKTEEMLEEKQIDQIVEKEDAEACIEQQQQEDSLDELYLKVTKTEGMLEENQIDHMVEKEPAEADIEHSLDELSLKVTKTEEMLEENQIDQVVEKEDAGAGIEQHKQEHSLDELSMKVTKTEEMLEESQIDQVVEKEDAGAGIEQHEQKHSLDELSLKVTKTEEMQEENQIDQVVEKEDAGAGIEQHEQEHSMDELSRSLKVTNTDEILRENQIDHVAGKEEAEAGIEQQVVNKLLDVVSSEEENATYNHEVSKCFFETDSTSEFQKTKCVESLEGRFPEEHHGACHEDVNDLELIGWEAINFEKREEMLSKIQFLPFEDIDNSVTGRGQQETTVLPTDFSSNGEDDPGDQQSSHEGVLSEDVEIVENLFTGDGQKSNRTSETHSRTNLPEEGFSENLVSGFPLKGQESFINAVIFSTQSETDTADNTRKFEGIEADESDLLYGSAATPPNCTAGRMPENQVHLSTTKKCAAEELSANFPEASIYDNRKDQDFDANATPFPLLEETMVSKKEELRLQGGEECFDCSKSGDYLDVQRAAQIHSISEDLKDTAIRFSGSNSQLPVGLKDAESMLLNRERDTLSLEKPKSANMDMGDNLCKVIQSLRDNAFDYVNMEQTGNDGASENEIGPLIGQACADSIKSFEPLDGDNLHALTKPGAGTDQTSDFERESYERAEDAPDAEHSPHNSVGDGIAFLTQDGKELERTPVETETDLISPACLQSLTHVEFPSATETDVLLFQSSELAEDVDINNVLHSDYLPEEKMQTVKFETQENTKPLESSDIIEDKYDMNNDYSNVSCIVRMQKVDVISPEEDIHTKKFETEERIFGTEITQLMNEHTPNLAEVMPYSMTDRECIHYTADEGTPTSPNGALGFVGSMDESSLVEREFDCCPPIKCNLLGQDALRNTSDGCVGTGILTDHGQKNFIDLPNQGNSMSPVYVQETCLLNFLPTHHDHDVNGTIDAFCGNNEEVQRPTHHDHDHHDHDVNGTIDDFCGNNGEVQRPNAEHSLKGTLDRGVIEAIDALCGNNIEAQISNNEHSSLHSIDQDLLRTPLEKKEGFFSVADAEMMDIARTTLPLNELDDKESGNVNGADGSREESMQQLDLTLLSLNRLRAMCKENGLTSRKQSNKAKVNFPKELPSAGKRSALKSLSSNITKTPTTAAKTPTAKVIHTPRPKNLLSAYDDIESVASPQVPRSSNKHFARSHHR